MRSCMPRSPSDMSRRRFTRKRGKIRGLRRALVALVVLYGVGAAGAAALDAPGDAVSLAPARAVFARLDFSGLPAPQRFQARDGLDLALRAYAPAAGTTGANVAILIHGSAGSSAGMHPLGRALAEAGWAVYAPDIRGHGASIDPKCGPGDIAYPGQLEDDLEDLVAYVRARHPNARLTLIGFSAGGGLALKHAGGAHGGDVDDYVLLAPFLGPFAPTTHQDRARWTSAATFRIVGLAMLNIVGIHSLDDLPVVRFATMPGDEGRFAAEYSYRLARDFGAGLDWKDDLAHLKRPMRVLVGTNDPLMIAAAYAPAFAEAGIDIPVMLAPGVAHVDLPTTAPGIAVIMKALGAVAPPLSDAPTG